MPTIWPDVRRLCFVLIASPVEVSHKDKSDGLGLTGTPGHPTMSLAKGVSAITGAEI
jgi:hypothetical protein